MSENASRDQQRRIRWTQWSRVRWTIHCEPTKYGRAGMFLGCSSVIYSERHADRNREGARFGTVVLAI
jgi:hypothetical protein